MPSVQELFNELEAGFYVVPEIQRSFVWRNPQIRDLASSIHNNFPIGSIIIWEMPNTFIESYGDLVRPLAAELPAKNGKYMVIDGQQRLTSLLLLYKGTLHIEDEQRKMELYFNPHEDIFSLERSSKILKDPSWYNVTEILASQDIQDVIEKKASETGDSSLLSNRGISRQLNMFKHGFETYEVSLVRAKLGYTGDFLELFEKISNIFVVLNSKGTRIKLPDLVLALVTGRTRRKLDQSFRESFKAIRKDLESMEWKIDETVLVRLYMAISTGVSKFAQAKEKIDKLEAKELVDFLGNTKQAIEKALDLLGRDIGIKNEEQLQSRYLLVPIAYLLHRDFISMGKIIPEAVKDEIRYWFILASIQGRYTGKLESDLGEDISSINQGKSAQGLLGNLRLKEIPSTFMDGEYERTHLAILSMLYNLNKAKDWDSSAVPQPALIKELKAQDIEFHHIFSKQFLKQHYHGDKSPDEAANITIISKRANDRIGDSNPADYIGELFNHDSELIARHFIPIEKDLWKAEGYDRFLECRRELILNSLGKVPGILVQGTKP
jgi:hypothetical protein